MPNLIAFIRDFYKNSGLLVFSSVLIEKFVMLLNTMFVVKMIQQDEFGRITLIASVLAFLTPWNGLGSLQVFIKYGSSESDQKKRDFLSQYLFRKGIINQGILAILFVILASFYQLKFDNLFWIIALFTVRLIGTFFHNHITIHYRINNKNNRFAQINILVSLIGLGLTFLLTYKLGANGYMIALAISPYLSLFFYPSSIFKQPIQVIKTFEWKSMWQYGRMDALAYFLSELLFAIDIFMIAIFMKDADIALYKVAIILPLNLAFISSVFLQTDFPKLVQNHRNKNYLNNYIKNYYFLFIPFSIVVIITSYFMKDWIIGFFFNDSYLKGNTTFFIATLAVIFISLGRSLFANLNSAVGHSDWNVSIMLVAILLLIILDLILIPIYRIEGAALGMAITFLVVGIFSRLLFKRYLKNL